MHVILVLLRKDFAGFRRNKAAVSLTFIVPFALICLFGQIFGVGRTDNGPSGIPLAVVNASDDPAAKTLVDALKAEKAFHVLTQFVNPDKTKRPLVESDLRPMMHENQFRFAVVIPSDLISSSSIGLHLKIYSNPRNDIETQMVTGILQKTIFSNVPQLLGQSLQARARDFIGSERLQRFNGALADAISKNFGGDRDEIQQRIASGNFGLRSLTAPDPATTPSPIAATTAAAPTPTPAPRADIFSRIVRIETTQVAGLDVKAPAATRLIGGWAMQFLLFSVSAGAAALFYERDFGIFQRVLAGPVTRAQILWSKFLYGVCLGLIQLMVLFFVGRLMYGVDIEHHLGLLILVCTFAAAACSAFGMLLASLVSTPEAASGIATLVILLMSAIGGAWFPISLMPAFIQQLSRFTIVYWSLEGFDQVLWSGATFSELLSTLGILGGTAAVVMMIAIWRFNRGKLFG